MWPFGIPHDGWTYCVPCSTHKTGWRETTTLFGGIGSSSMVFPPSQCRSTPFCSPSALSLQLIEVLLRSNRDIVHRSSIHKLHFSHKQPRRRNRDCDCCDTKNPDGAGRVSVRRRTGGCSVRQEDTGDQKMEDTNKPWRKPIVGPILKISVRANSITLALYSWLSIYRDVIEFSIEKFNRLAENLLVMPTSQRGIGISAHEPSP